MHKELIAEQFLENTLRCDFVVPMFLLNEASIDKHMVVEAIVEYDESLYKALSIAKEDVERLDNVEAVEDYLCYENIKTGYLGRFSQAVPINFSKESSGHTYSWGYYRTSWFYADTLEGLFDKVIEWGKVQLDNDRIAYFAKKRTQT